MDDLKEEKQRMSSPDPTDETRYSRRSAVSDETRLRAPASEASSADAKTIIKPSGRANDAKTRIKSSHSPNKRKPQALVDDGTVIKAANIRSQETLSKTKGEDITVFNKAISSQRKQISPGAQDHAEALTQIRNVIRAQDTSKGYRVAKKAATKALSENKIILNKRFVLEETLGAGGMGTVYKARDIRKIEANDANPYIAVKVLNDDFREHPDAFVTLQREASRTHILSHPNIVTVHDFDRDGDVIYMTMELLEGQSLDNIIRQHKDQGLPKEKAFEIIKAYCNALQFAHEKNIVHSDFKPGNIFVTKNSTKVLDFGIARFTNVAADEFDAGELGAITPAYASLAMIENQAPDPRDDVYAAGIIAYELLSGVHPYNRKPADEAYAEKLKPKRIKDLSSRQWKALEGALQIEREKRTDSIEDFISELTEQKKIPVFKLLSLVLLMAVGGFSYYSYFVQDGLNKQISQTFSKAEACFQEQDYSCTLETAKAVLALSPGHSGAKTLRDQSSAALKKKEQAELFAQAQECLSKQKSLLCAQTKLVILEDMQADQSNVEQLKKAIDNFIMLSKIDEHYENANKCFQKNDFDCTLLLTDKVLILSPGHERALALKREASEKVELLEKKNAEKMQTYRSLLVRGEKCFNKARYDCAIDYANKARAVFPGSEAQSLKQKATFNREQQSASVQKASGFVSKASQCLERKNYNCAIANAESALAFVSDYQPALSIIRKARKEIADIKKIPIR